MDVHYSAESQLHNPRQLVRTARHDFHKARLLAKRLFVHQIKAQYRQSLLGYGWLLLPPLATMLVWTYLRGSQLIAVGQTNVPYPLFVLAGTLLWQLFVDALNAPLRQLQRAQATLTTINFPIEALLLSGVIDVVFNFIIRLSLLVVGILVAGVSLHLTLFAAPLGMIALVVLGTGLGIWLAILGSLYHDITRGLAIVISLWFFVTPIIYPLSTSGGMARIARLNPVSPLLTVTRDWLLTGSTNNLILFGGVFAMSCLLLVVGWLTIRLARPHLIARLST